MAEWHGLTLSVAQRLEQHLCRTAMRGPVYGHTAPTNAGETSLVSDVRGMTGRFLAAGLDWLQNHNTAPSEEEQAGWARVPTRRQLSKAVEESESGMTRFISGKPTGATNWHVRGKTAVEYLFLGDPEMRGREDPEGEFPAVRDVHNRVSEWVFRAPAENDWTPRLFRGLRRYSNAPYSMKELAQEIEWLGRQRNVSGDEATRLVVASHDAPFITEHNDVASAVHNAGMAGVSCSFIHAEEDLRIIEGDSSAKGSLDAFLKTLPASLRKQLITTELSADQSGPDQLSMVFPAMQWVYLSTMLEGEPYSRLWLVRAPVDGHQTEATDKAVTIGANRPEQETFEAWLKLVDGGKAATPRASSKPTDDAPASKKKPSRPSTSKPSTTPKKKTGS